MNELCNHCLVFIFTCLWTLDIYVISGSHDTMTYHLDDCSPVVQSESLFLRVLDHCFPCVMRPCVKRWATTQVCIN